MPIKISQTSRSNCLSGWREARARLVPGTVTSSRSPARRAACSFSISAFFFALHIIVVSYYSKRVSALQLSALQFFIAGILFLPCVLLFENPNFSELCAGYQPILFTGIIVTAGAYTFQILGHKATHPVLATLILSTEAIFAVIGGIILLKETLNLREISGCFLMIAAIVLSQLPFKHKKQSDDLSI